MVEYEENQNLNQAEEDLNKFVEDREKKFSRGPVRLIGLGILLFLVCLLITLSAFIISGLNWLNTTWPDLNMAELMYEINAPLEGTGKEMVQAFLLNCILPTIFIAGLLILLIIFKKRIRVWKWILTVSLLLSVSGALGIGTST